MPRISDNQRHQALGMIQGGMSRREIARRMQCSPSTITRLAQRHQQTGSLNDRPRPGRQREMTPQQDRYIILQHLRDRFRTAVQTSRETVGVHCRRIGASTVRRRLRHNGLRARRPFRGNMLTPQRRRNRLVWTQQRQRWAHRQWSSVLWSDESRFHLRHSDGRTRVWRRRGERYVDPCIQETDHWGGGSVMIWGGISLNHRTPLVVINGNLTAQRYINEVLRPTVIPFFPRHQEVDIFQQNNARAHSARVTTAFLNANNVRTLPWPAFSPDLSPIEHLWDQLGQAVRRRQPMPITLRQLENALQEEWNNIPQDRIRRLIRSMPRRCRACVAANGGHIRY